MSKTPPTTSECVVVAVRKRPRLPKEIQEGRQEIVTIVQNQIALTDPSIVGVGAASKSFTFDIVIDEGHEQRALYDEIAYPLIESVIDGYNGTIFAYGQTGCGKTWTMTGDTSTPKQYGIIPNSFDHIFEAVAVGVDGEEEEEEDGEEEGEEGEQARHTKTTTVAKKFLVQASYLEIYNEEIRDLLSCGVATKDTEATSAVDARRLKLKEHPDRGVYVEGLTWADVHDVESMNVLMQRGIDQRTTASTAMNESSSRSHAIFTIRIESSSIISSDPTNPSEMFRVGVLNLVDLVSSCFSC